MGGCGVCLWTCIKLHVCACVLATDREKHTPCAPFISSPCISAACFPPETQPEGKALSFSLFTRFMFVRSHDKTHIQDLLNEQHEDTDSDSHQSAIFRHLKWNVGGWKLRFFSSRWHHNCMVMIFMRHSCCKRLKRLKRKVIGFERRANEEMWSGRKLGLEKHPLFLNAKVKAHASMRILQL